MLSGSALRKGILWLIMAGVPTTAPGQQAHQNAPKIALVPLDPLEMVTGQVQVAVTPASREATVQLMARARDSYQLRNVNQPWDLKVRFTVDSRGETNYDGTWVMEDMFSPGQGVHWTALSSSGYAITGIFAINGLFADGTASAIPLRLQEARAMLFNPIPSVEYARKGSIRTFASSFNGSPVACVLLAQSHNIANPALGRGWEESEDCIDPVSGLLQVHSEAPGRYAIYDYSDASRLGTHILPRTVTVTEAGRIVSTISVESLQGSAAPDADLFVPTEGMNAAGKATAMTSIVRIPRILGPSPFKPGMTVRPVCVFGLVTPTGQLVEAHSLQPFDPNSEAAVKDATAIDFAPSMPAGAPPQQHFAFVIEEFVSRE